MPCSVEVFVEKRWDLVHDFATESRLDSVVWDMVAALVGLACAALLRPWRTRAVEVWTVAWPATTAQIVWAGLLIGWSLISEVSVPLFVLGWTLFVWYGCRYFPVAAIRGTTQQSKTEQPTAKQTESRDDAALAWRLTIIGWLHLTVSLSDNTHWNNLIFGACVVAVLYLLWPNKNASSSMHVVNTVAYAYGGTCVAFIRHTAACLKTSVLALHALRADGDAMRRSCQLFHFVWVNALVVQTPLQVLCNRLELRAMKLCWNLVHNGVFAPRPALHTHVVSQAATALVCLDELLDFLPVLCRLNRGLWLGRRILRRPARFGALFFRWHSTVQRYRRGGHGVCVCLFDESFTIDIGLNTDSTRTGKCMELYN